jgi:hypothetical protein
VNPYHHALSSVSKHGGCVEDYLPIHHWFDESKAFFPDVRHRALRHHAEGIFLCERIFGSVVTNSDGKVIPTRFLGEQHVLEDLGRIPTVQDWLECLVPQPWMLKAGKPASVTLDQSSAAPCECEQPGTFHSGVPGILARMEQGKLAPDANVERCDLCERYPDDEAAWQELVRQGLA